MMVLVDTPVWSLVLRRRRRDLSENDLRIAQELNELVRADRVRLLGTVRQERLSGIRENSQFQRIREHLRSFDDVLLMADDYEEAARMSNQCKGSGIAPSPADMLLCAVSTRRSWYIFSTDRDFVYYGRVLHLRSHWVASG